MRVFGTKEMVLEEEKDLGEGRRQAGLSQIVAFVLEPLTRSNCTFWGRYVSAMQQCGKASKQADQLDVAIRGFQNALNLVDASSSQVYVAYSTFDPATAAADDVHKMINIQMCMTVTTSAKARCPVVTHMGIFRSPLLSADLAQLNTSLGEIHAVLSKTPDFYKGKAAKGISLVLHSFAARAMVQMLNGHEAELMITAPVEHMGGILSKVGAIQAVDKSGLHGGPQQARALPGSPRPKTLLLSKQSRPPRQLVPMKKEQEPLPKETGPSGLERPLAQLDFWLKGLPFERVLNIKYKDCTHEWTFKEYPWLFELAFNMSHKFKPTFTDLRALRELHQDLRMSSGPHVAKVVNMK